MDLAARSKAIDLLILDVDGVLTDGRLLYGEAGEQLKSFHVRDGSGIKLWQSTGKQVAIISGRNAKGVIVRAAELGIDIVMQGQHPKDAAYLEALSLAKTTPDRVCVIGDDLMDLPLMLASGLSVAVGDAVPEAKAVASHVTRAHGGHGAVREAIEWLMTGAETWDAAIAKYRVAVG